jgi:hypothetical protein
MKSFLQLIFCLILYFWFIPSANAYITKSGNVSGEYWHNTDTYFISDNITVDSGAVFEIEAGTCVKFAHGKSITVYGSIICKGVFSSKITFTSMDDNSIGEIISGSDGVPEQGDWNRIYVTGTPSAQGIGIFYYVDVKYGGASNAGLYFYTADSADVRNCSIKYSRNYGLLDNNSNLLAFNCNISYNGNHGIYSSGSGTEINNCYISNNGGYAAYIVNALEIKSYSNNSGLGNAINAFSINGTIKKDYTLSKTTCGFPFVINGLVTVSGDYTLTIPAGEVVKFNGTSAGFRIYGTLSAIGTDSDNVVFTSFYDDTYGGDLNGDGSATNPAKGDWRFIYLNGLGDDKNGIGYMDYCKVLYGGAGNSSLVYFYYSKDGYFKNGLIQYSKYRGLQASIDTLSILNSSVLNCNDFGLSLNYVVLNLNNCIVNNNGKNGIHATSSELEINNCTFNNNNGYAAYLYNMNKILDCSNNSGSGNAIDAFAISGTIDKDYTLSESVCGFPFVIIGNVTLTDNHTLTIPAGEVLKFNGTGAGFTVNGTLNAIGTSTDSIIFTSFYDDTYGGDLNGDGGATSPAKGDWRNIYLYGSGTSYQGIGNIDYCKVLYGGYGNNNAVKFYYSDSGYFKNSLIQYSDSHGLYAYYDTINAANSMFLDCDGNGVYAYHSVLNLNNSILNNNGNDGIYAAGTSELEINNC